MCDKMSEYHDADNDSPNVIPESIKSMGLNIHPRTIQSSAIIANFKQGKEKRNKFGGTMLFNVMSQNKITRANAIDVFQNN